MSHWSRRRNLAYSTIEAASEWAESAPTSALVRIIAEDACPGTRLSGDGHESPATRFVDAAVRELDLRIPARVLGKVVTVEKDGA